MDTTAPRGARFRAGDWMTRSLQALRLSASLAAPGFAQAVAGRSRAAGVFALAGAAVIVATGLATALIACTCPLVVGACAFAMVGAAALAHELAASRRGPAPHRPWARRLALAGLA